ncbi:MAG: ASKHA domain-containing protein, partial [Actinomycetota bacterium]
MRAAPGAIERVVIEPDTCKPIIQTIGDKKAGGICGSGILDSIAELRKAEIIDTRGKFVQDSDCICRDKQGNYQYILVGKDGTNESCQEDISINQKDIVEIQLAKGAMRTGIDILLKNAGIDFTQIDKIIIAGAFGSYIDPKNVINIGMFPNVPLERIIQVGNAAGVGSKMVLISAAERKKAEGLAKKVKYLELTTHPEFQDYFVNSLKFPQPEEII